jgi:DNA-binding CsgD family transcriptional regulator
VTTGAASTGATAIVGREAELRSVQAFLAGLEHGPAALVLSGEPGIGKTALWDKGVEQARRFARVLAHRSVEAEAPLSFVGLTDLLAPVFDTVAPQLPAPRREALEVALLLVKPGDAAPDPRAIGLALLDVLRVLTADGPVVVALDDVHWLDPSSAAVLQIALRRLERERVGLLATLRTAPAVASALEVEDAFAEDQRELLRLAPLSLGALYRVLRERLGLELTRPELVRLRELSGGNPFFALELGRELVRTDTRPAPGQAMRVPDSLHELLGGRLGRLPAETTALLVGAAALARPTVDLLAGARGDAAAVRAALEAAVREGVVAFDGSLVRFAHPLLASICYAQAPPAQRRDVHRALAAAVADLEERARHLALATDGPDAAVAGDLDEAADVAAARGATAAAAELCELAAGLSPNEPAASRARRLRAANFHRLAGDAERAVAMLEALRDEAPPGVERADVLLALASTFRADPATMIALSDDALAHAAGDDARCAQILALRTWAQLFKLDIPASLVDARAALERAQRSGDPRLLTVAIARLGQVETWTGDVTPGLLERGAKIERRCGLVLGYQESPRVPLARLLMRLGEIERSRALLEDLDAEAVARGDEGTRVVVLWSLSMLEWLAGRWPLALDHATAAYELAEQTQHAHTRAWVGRVRALVEADLGLVEQARASAAEGMSISQASSNEFFLIASLGALGRLELALGNLQAAGDLLRELPARLRAAGMGDPTNPVWADAIEALIALGELPRAAEYLEYYERQAGRLGGSWARASATRCRGLLAAAGGDLEAAFTAFAAARDELAGTPYEIERARTLLCLGSARVQARQRRLAREALDEALAICETLGARLWAQRARVERKRISGRRAAPDELTETEARVAALAAAGRSNPEIAAALFMGRSTVESHLSRVYRKLGVRSRIELAARLPAPVPNAAKPVDPAPQG